MTTITTSSKCEGKMSPYDCLGIGAGVMLVLMVISAFVYSAIKAYKSGRFKGIALALCTGVGIAAASIVLFVIVLTACIGFGWCFGHLFHVAGG